MEVRDWSFVVVVG